MIAAYNGITIEIDHLNQLCALDERGISMQNLLHAAELIGFRPMAVNVDLETLKKIAECAISILHINNHYVVLYNYHAKPGMVSGFQIADPANGLVMFTDEELARQWCHTTGSNVGLALVFASAE